MKFVASVTLAPSEFSEIRQLLSKIDNGLNLFAHVLITPLFASPQTLEAVKILKEEQDAEVYFDSGGYYVQQGKIDYDELYPKLMKCYLENQWADWYVLPDHVPTSRDSLEEVDRKVNDTITLSRLFYDNLPANLQSKAIPVVQGHSLEQIQRCAEGFLEMDVDYIGFGSFGTNNVNNVTNVVDISSLKRIIRLNQIIGNKSIKLHLFGVSTPPLFFIFHKLDIYSLDSISWVRSAAYGKVFLPFIRAYNVSHRSIRNSAFTEMEFGELKHITEHDCPFCSSFQDLSSEKINRVLHNLVVMVEIEDKLQKMNEYKIVEIIKQKSPRYYKLFEELIDVFNVSLP